MAEPPAAGREHPLLAVAAIWPAGGGLVMVRPHGQALWSLPGGEVAAGETLAEAVVRTVGEHTGAESLCGPFVGWSELPDADPAGVTMYFEAVVLDAPAPEPGSGALPDGPAGDQVRAVPDWEVSELPVAAGLAEFLADQGLIELVI